MHETSPVYRSKIDEGGKHVPDPLYWKDHGVLTSTVQLDNIPTPKWPLRCLLAGWLTGWLARSSCFSPPGIFTAQRLNQKKIIRELS